MEIMKLSEMSLSDLDYLCKEMKRDLQYNRPFYSDELAKEIEQNIVKVRKEIKNRISKIKF